MSKKIKAYRYGIFAEFCSTLFLKIKFYKILNKRYKTKLGEIDIIAKKSQKIIFVEVKARKKHEKHMEILTSKQKRRIARTAQLFIQRNPKYNDFDYRFDLIYFSSSTLPKHIKNAW